MAELATNQRVEGIVSEVGPATLARQLRMFQRAIREGWPVSAEHKRMVIEDAERTLKDPEASTRERIEADKIILLAENSNMKIDDQAIKLMAMERGQAPGSTVNNTLNINGPAEMFREVITQLRNGNNAAPRPEQAATEPAGDD